MSALTAEAMAHARRLVATALECPLDAVTDDASVDNLAAWDSIAHVRLLLAIEAETGRSLDSDTIANLRSVADVAAALE
jgi:acyl carrier protein